MPFTWKLWEKRELNSNCEFSINISQIKKGNNYCWHITHLNNKHNHLTNSFSFVHKYLTEETKDLIITLTQTGVSNTQIAMIIEKQCQIKLTREQISSVAKAEKRSRIKDKISESEELRNYMNQIGGISHILVYKSNDIVKRKGIATFTMEELQNLQNYGEFIVIDPTFYTLTSNWTIIPITVIGPEREIRSGGLIFSSSTKSEIFRWILKLLLNELPSKGKMNTLCSDDDAGIEGAFTMIQLEENNNEFKLQVSKINKIICFWHKLSNFVRYLSTLKLPQDEEKRIITLFRKMGMTRSKELCLKCYQELMNMSYLTNYMENNISEKLNFFAKSHINGFNCGYNTSSVAESNNRRIKNLLPNRALTLREIRALLISAEEYSMMSRRYVKGKKLRKLRSPLIINILKHFDISENIAEAIAGSIEKSEKLEYEPFDDFAIITEKKFELNGEYCENYIVTSTECECKKQEHTGLPCSHIIRYWKEMNMNVYDQIKIAERWKITKASDPLEQLSDANHFTEESVKVVPTTNHERFILLRAKGLSLIGIASRTQNGFECLSSILDEAEIKLTQGQEAIVQDEIGVTPGRPPINQNRRITKQIKSRYCAICKKPHSTKRCPRRNELLKYIPEGMSKCGTKHCGICGYGGHNSCKCPAKELWLKAIDDGILPPI